MHRSLKIVLLCACLIVGMGIACLQYVPLYPLDYSKAGIKSGNNAVINHTDLARQTSQKSTDLLLSNRLKTNNMYQKLPVIIQTPYLDSRTEVFSRFNQWLEQGRSSQWNDPQLIAAGIKLASERQREMEKLIRRDPKRALELAVPRYLYSRMPQEILDHLETPISAEGVFEVLLALPESGKELAKITYRQVKLDGQKYEAFVYGRRMDLSSRDQIPIHGIALGNKMAISEDPLRLIQSDERATIPSSSVPDICEACQQPIKEATRLLDNGHLLLAACSDQHVQQLQDRRAHV